MNPRSPKRLSDGEATIEQRLIKHDKYLEDLSGQIAHDYDVIVKNVPLYSGRNRKVAEIDILAMKDDVCDIYEVKCSYRITKAKKQLAKVKRLLRGVSRIRHAFFFCGATGGLVLCDSV